MKRDPTVVLYRSVGQSELELIRESGFREFPPRLPWQRIFNPVLTREYAEQLASDWNVKDKAGGYSGFVTRFEVDAAFLSRYQPHQVGNSIHREYWVPAAELADFNLHIRGRIEVIAEYHGIPDGA